MGPELLADTAFGNTATWGTYLKDTGHLEEPPTVGGFGSKTGVFLKDVLMDKHFSVA